MVRLLMETPLRLFYAIVMPRHWRYESAARIFHYLTKEFLSVVFPVCNKFKGDFQNRPLNIMDFITYSCADETYTMSANKAPDASHICILITKTMLAEF